MLAIGAGLMMLGASYSSGWSVGFLFGLPKLVAKPGTERYQANTNLEKLSDWLPTALTGAGLVGASAIIFNVHAANTGLGKHIEVHPMILDAMVALGIAAGVVRGYLETRLNLQKSMLDMDRECNADDDSAGDVAEDSPAHPVPLPTGTMRTSTD